MFSDPRNHSETFQISCLSRSVGLQAFHLNQLVQRMAEAPPGEDQSGSPRMEDSMKKLWRICSSLALAVAIAACQGKQTSAPQSAASVAGTTPPIVWTGAVPCDCRLAVSTKDTISRCPLMVHIRLSSISETGRVSPGTSRVHSSASAVAFRR